MSEVIFQNFSKSFPEKKVFENFNRAFGANKIHVIMGPSGCGKTTLLNALAGLTDYEGEIYACGREHKNVCRCSVSYVFQEARLIPQKTVFKNLSFALKDAIPDKVTRTVEINLMLKRVGLGGVTDTYPQALSGGMVQRVALARAFLYPAGLLLMDEPFKGLDTDTKAHVFNTFFALWKDAPRTCFFVTHDIAEADIIKNFTSETTLFEF